MTPEQIATIAALRDAREAAWSAEWEHELVCPTGSVWPCQTCLTCVADAIAAEATYLTAQAEALDGTAAGGSAP